MKIHNKSIIDVDKFISKIHASVKKTNPLFKDTSKNKQAPVSAKDLIAKYHTDAVFKNWVDIKQSEAISIEIEKEKKRLLKYANKYLQKFLTALDKKPSGGTGLGRSIGYFHPDEWYFNTFFEWMNDKTVNGIDKKDTDFALNQVIDVIHKERDKRLNLPKILYTNEK